jgi:hypothetical protein
MAGKNINHLSDVAEQLQNTPGELTPILKVGPEQGTMLTFLNRVEQGDARGLPIYAKWLDSNGDPLPVDTMYVLTAKQPGDARFSPVSIKEDNISGYINKSVTEQQNSDNIDSVKVELKGRAVNIRDVDEFAIEINSSEQIDWSAGSETYVERSGVRERKLK